MSVKSIYLKNVGSVKEATLNLSPVTLLIGANGVGKKLFLNGLWSIGGYTAWGTVESGFLVVRPDIAAFADSVPSDQEIRIFTSGNTPPFECCFATDEVFHAALDCQPGTVILSNNITGDLHPRLFQREYERLHRLAKEKDLTIVGITYNPYFVDQFKGNEGAVLIVEHGEQTTFTPLAERLDGLEVDAESLGMLWYSGLVGGVP